MGTFNKIKVVMKVLGIFLLESVLGTPNHRERRNDVSVTGSYQAELDAYCGQMSKQADPETEFYCPTTKNMVMKARYSFNTRGKNRGWRCYGLFESTSAKWSCVANDGSLTNEGCSDPDYSTRPMSICDRRAQMNALIVKLRNQWATEEATVAPPVIETTTALITYPSNVPVSGPFQDELDAYCAKMSKHADPNSEFYCPTTADTIMKARHSYNFVGKLIGWKCYGLFQSTSESSACMANDGSLTNEGCSDPDFAIESVPICDRRHQMNALIVNLRNKWIADKTTTAVPEATTAETTEAPATEAPTTEAPTTEASATEAPTTEAPATVAPATEATTTKPVTEAPTTKPVTEAPTTEAPATEVPATEAPATEAPATEAPATEAPTTEAPATEAPATEAPATEAPATEAPATEAPATEAPATEAPATEAPATEAPATEAPTTSVQIVSEMKMTTMIEFSEALTDPSSEEYRIAAENIKAVFFAEMEKIAESMGMTLESITVLFEEGQDNDGRRRRSTSTEAVITSVYSVPVSESTDLTQLENDVTSSTTTAANAAIANSGGDVISSDAVITLAVEITTDEETNEGPCPSTECWTYDSSLQTCTMNNACASLTCGATAFDLSFKSALFNLDDGQSLVTVSGGLVSPTWGEVDQQWATNAPLGENGMTYTVENNEITFSLRLAVIGNDMKTRTDDVQDNKIDFAGFSLTTTPFGAAVIFTCTYSTTINVGSQQFAVTGASVADQVNGIGSLAAGFTMTLNNGETPTFLLGESLPVALTWSVTNLSKLTFFIDQCTVTHGTSAIMVVKNGCYSSALGVVSNQSRQEFSYQIFKGVGQTEATQKVRCTANICEVGKCQYPIADNECPADGEDAFYHYTI